MKKMLSLVAFVLFKTGTCCAQNGEVNFDKVRFNNLAFSSSKARIIQHLGKPVSVAEPRYECGAHSSAEQGKKFYELRYGQAAFIGTATSTYQLEHVTFPANRNVVLNYGQWKFTHQTTIQDLKRVFGPSLDLNSQKNDVVLVLVRSKYDDGAMFSFTAGLLTRFEYWSPC